MEHLAPGLRDGLRNTECTRVVIPHEHLEAARTFPSDSFHIFRVGVHGQAKVHRATDKMQHLRMYCFDCEQADMPQLTVGMSHGNRTERGETDRSKVKVYQKQRTVCHPININFASSQSKQCAKCASLLFHSVVRKTIKSSRCFEGQ